MSKGTYEHLAELHDVACAAAFALKSIDGFLESRCDQDGFSYEDAAGCDYSIKRAIHLLSEITRAEGLKADPLYPEWGAPLAQDLQANSQSSPN